MSVSTIRFTGLASGLDTESIVNSMIAPAKLKVEASQKDKQLLEWKKDEYKTVSTKVYNFFNTTLSNMRLQSNFNAIKTNVSNSTAINLNENQNGLSEGTHSVQVKQLAEGATVPSGVVKYNDTSTGELQVAKSTTKLTELGLQEGQGITIKTPAGTITVRLGDPKTNSKGETSLGADGEPLTINTIGDLTTQIQTELTGTDINFKFDEKNGAFMISSKKTGANQKIELADADGGTTVLDKFQLKSNTDGKYVFGGKDAEIIYNGSLEVASDTNNIEVNGLKFTAVNVTTEPVKIVATAATEQTIKAVTDFVKEYNSLIEELNTLVSTKPPSYGEYRPLTDEQKEAMSESEIEKWEEKAKQGMFYKDPSLEALLSSMRSILSASVDGNEFGNLQSVGIKTTGNWKDKGKLEVDEDAFKKAIEKNADDVMKLFTANTKDSSDGEKGIGTRLYNDLFNRFKSSTSKSANNLFNDKALDKQIKQKTTRISELQEKMDAMETLYYKRFTAMEKMLSQMQSNSGFLSQQSSS